ncbi:hypothetical protein TL16_g09195 [Triparma laevis f. inornata]|uniref:Uncharacterized protein n=1 Tax=Triparma laevis f. inornata TaxID=1714386 RepID=A0A9W7EKT0_9STRA|nr:hypothetical protein TL16_g09195 [Triparma laevis f. inornata]
MLRFTFRVHYRIRRHLPIWGEVGEHLERSGVFVCGVVGVGFFLKEFYNDKTIAIAVFSALALFVCGVFLAHGAVWFWGRCEVRDVMLGKVHEGRMRILPGAEVEEEGGGEVGDEVLEEEEEEVMPHDPRRVNRESYIEDDQVGMSISRSSSPNLLDDSISNYNPVSVSQAVAAARREIEEERILDEGEERRGEDYQWAVRG